jgi:hypothetical protein
MGTVHARASDQLTVIVDNRNGDRAPVLFCLLEHGGNGPLRFFQS